MLILPTSIMALLEPFRPVFYLSTWIKVQVLLVGVLPASSWFGRGDRVQQVSSDTQPYGSQGRPRKKAGALWARLPTLATLLTNETTHWTQTTVTWYQGTVRPMEIATATTVWYHTGKPPVPIRWLLIRDPQQRHDPVALLCTNPHYSPEQIIEWSGALWARRWSIEVTFEETRAHLGVETQRQWSNLAILRTTPALLALFSWVTLVAHTLHQTQPPPTQQAAWYSKPLPTFADALATVRYRL